MTRPTLSDLRPDSLSQATRRQAAEAGAGGRITPVTVGFTVQTFARFVSLPQSNSSRDSSESDAKGALSFSLSASTPSHSIQSIPVASEGR
jgi:hypothetical protein